MDSPQYHEFGSFGGSNIHGEQRITPQKGMKRRLFYFLYGFLVLLLLIILLVTGIKFSQLNKEIADVKLYLETINNSAMKGQPSSLISSSNSDSATVPEVIFERIVPVRGSCEEGWVFFENSCYMLSSSRSSWTEAEKQCQTHDGAHLVVLNTAGELDYISKIVPVLQNYWIGLVEREHEGHWSWVDGTDFNSTPAFWDKGQPDDWDYRLNGEDCGQLHATEKRKRKLWNDADCTLQYRYICEVRK